MLTNVLKNWRKNLLEKKNKKLPNLTNYLKKSDSVKYLFNEGNKMQNKFRFRFGKATLISSLIGSVGYFVVNDLKKENSLIKNTFKKIPFVNKLFIKKNNTQIDSNNMRIINESNQKIIK